LKAVFNFSYPRLEKGGRKDEGRVLQKAKVLRMEVISKPMRKLVLLTVILFLFLLSPPHTLADMPAQNDAFVRWEQFHEAIVRHFSAEDADLFRKKLQPTIATFRSRSLPEPFKKEAKSFTYVGSAGTFIAEAVALMKPYLTKNDVTRVRGFLGTLNNNKLIQGWASSRNYVGCIAISLELQEDPSSEYILKAFLTPFDRPGFRNSHRTDGYKGMTLSYPTRVFARPRGKTD
jgi:hypothetical protein